MDINEIRNRILNEAEIKDYDDTLMDISTYCEEVKLAVDRLVHGIEYTKRLPSDFVFDENKSVKWNREMVIKTNSETEERKKLKREFEFVGKDIVRESIIKDIVKYYNLTEASAKLIYSKVADEACDRDIDFMDNIDWIISMIDDYACLCIDVMHEERKEHHD